MTEQVASTRNVQHVVTALLIGLLAWPITYITNQWIFRLYSSAQAVWIFVCVTVVLILIIQVVKRLSPIKDGLYYGSNFCVFTSMITLIMTLEKYGLVSGFTDFYQQVGETYLKYPYGFAVTHFDGVGFMVMYLVLIFQLSNGRSWRSMTLYWSSGLVTNMGVIIFGYFVGKLEFSMCFLLNLPFFLFPIYGMIRAFTELPRASWTVDIQSSIKGKIYDLWLTYCLGISILITFFKGAAILGSKSTVVQLLKYLEPSIVMRTPAPYAKFQHLLYLAYSLPVQLLSFYYFGRLKGKPGFIWDLALINAGIILPGQICYMIAARHPESEGSYRANKFDIAFWLNNTFLLILPHLILLRLTSHRGVKKVPSQPEKKKK